MDNTIDTAGGKGETATTTNPRTPSSRSRLVYVHIFNPIRTSLRKFLQENFHVSLGDEEKQRTCVHTPSPSSVLYYHDYIAPYTTGQGEQLNLCRAIENEYFIFRLSESTVRWIFESIMPYKVRTYLLDNGVVELTMAEEE